MRKRTFINALLFGALIVAPASTFVSCSDYDDDIAGLRNDLDATKQDLQTLVNEKISAVEQELTNLQNADDALTQAYKDADEALRLALTQADEELRQQLEKAITEGDAATLAAAQELVNSAKEELQKALDECKANCNGQIDDLIAADAELSKAINDAKAKAEDAMTLATTANETANAALELANANKEELSEIWTLLTGQESSLTETIGALQTTVNTLTEQYSTLSDELDEASKKIAENEAAILAQKTALEAYQKLTDENKEAIEQAQKDLAELEEALAAQKTELESLIAQEVAKVQQNVDNLDAKVESIKAEHDAQIQTLQSDIQNLQDELVKTNGNLLMLKDRLNYEVNVLNLLIGQELRSLVFKPELYVDGVEAAEYNYMMYQYYTEMAKHGDVLNSENKVCKFGDEAIIPTTLSKAKEYDPIVYIQYHMNPSSATIDEGALSFVSRDAEFITRANESKACLTIEEYSVKDGILTVGMTAVGSNVDNKATDEAAIFALQAKIRKGERTESSVGRDTLITSDYAMLYSTKLSPEALAFNEDRPGARECTGTKQKLTPELYMGLDEVMAAPASFELKYNSQEGLDLKKFLEVHYAWDTNTKNQADHGRWAYGEEAQYGFSYKFDLIDYTVGNNGTSDSRYAKLNGGVLTACTVDAQGNPTNEQGESSIGREPLVRVTLVDKEGNVVLYGFVKVKIVRETSSLVTTPFAYSDVDVDACNVATFDVTWAQVSAQILEKVGMANDEFALNYTLDEDEYGIVQQYRPVEEGTPADGSEFVKVESSKATGTVFPREESDGQLTTTLEWNLSPVEQQAIYESEGRTATIYVAYVPRAASSGLSPVYLPLTVTFNEKAEPVALQLTPNKAFWLYGPSQDKPGMAVLAPTDNGNTRTWQVGVRNALEGNKINVPEAYAKLNTRFQYYLLPSETADGKYKLTTATGMDKAHDKYTDRTFDATAENERQYIIDATDGIYRNTTLYLNGEAVASIDAKSGVITMANTSAAKELINAYASDPASAPSAFIKVGVALVNTACDVVLPLTDGTNTIMEYILRPINMAANVGQHAFVDAASNNSSSVNLYDVLQFSDWRGENLKTATTAWYFAYYEFQSVTVNTAQITTNMNSNDGSYRLLSDVAPGIQVSYERGSFTDLQNLNNQASSSTVLGKITGMFGKLTYKNNTGNPIGAGNKLRIPVTVNYYWGSVTVTVEIPINPAN